MQINNPDDHYPVWQCMFKARTIIGAWHSADGEKIYKIRLKENYPPGVTRFTYHYLNKKIPAFKKKKTPYEKLSISYPVTLGNTPQGVLIKRNNIQK